MVDYKEALASPSVSLVLQTFKERLDKSGA